MRLLLRLIGNAVALYAAAHLVDGIQFAGGGQVEFGSLLAVALIFRAVNAVIKPVVKVATCPAHVVTLGLFTFVVNALMLMLAMMLGVVIILRMVNIRKEL